MMLVLLNILYFQNILSSSCPRTNVGSNTESDQMPRKGRKVSSFWWTVLGANYVFYGLSNSHVQMWELDHKEDWMPKNWCFWTVVLEKTLESHLNCKEIQPVHPKGNQSWIFIGRTDAEAEAPILWLPDAKSQLIRKDPDAGKDWRQKEKGTTEDEMVGWHHHFNEQELGQTLGDGEGQWGLAYSSPWGCKELNTTWQLNRQTNWMQTYLQCVRKCMLSRCHVHLFVNPWTVAHQVPLCMGLSRHMESPCLLKGSL